jgi:hypothetical protein
LELAVQDRIARNQLIAVHDIVQLDPAQCNWGSVLAVVDRVYVWGVRVYIFVPPHADGAAYMRVPHGQYVRIGRAEWALKDNWLADSADEVSQAEDK